MTRQTLERYQVFVFVAAIVAGLAFGRAVPRAGAALEVALWPALGLLLYATFTQIGLARLREAFLDARFLAAAVVGNFVLLPLVVWGLLALTPGAPAIRLGVALVLLVPCTDWFITFTQLGGGDARRAIAFAPLSLLLQMLLLPLYLWLLLGEGIAVAFARDEVLWAFAGLILTPLLAAWATQRLARAATLEHLAWAPVPLLALVVFLIAASQVGLVMGSAALLIGVLPVFVVFLLLAGPLAVVLARVFRLPTTGGRTLAFSLGTRNSFVVLPLALALPASFEPAVLVIVFQSLVELFGMAVYLWWVPRQLFPKTE